MRNIRKLINIVESKEPNSVLSKGEREALRILQHEKSILRYKIPDRNETNNFGELLPGILSYKKLAKRGLCVICDPYVGDDGFEWPPCVEITSEGQQYDLYLHEGYFSFLNLKDRNQKINKRIFGRDTPEMVASPTPNPDEIVQEPTDPNMKRELSVARQYKNADDYAYSPSVNMYMPIKQHDPLSIRDNAEGEANRLRRRWNYWKNKDLI